MLRSYVTKKHLFFYFVAIMITWLEAIITPALIQYIVSSFTNHQLHLLWQVLFWGIVGNLILLLGLVRETLLLCTSADSFKLGIKKGYLSDFSV